MLESTRNAEPLPPRNQLTIASPGQEPENQWALTEADWDPSRYRLELAVARDLSSS